MGKLHELLAVEASLKGAVDKVMAESQKTFDGRNAAYTGFSKTYKPFNDEDKDCPPPEGKPVGYTVSQKVAYINDHYIKLLDCLLQKELGNQKAVADIKITIDDGKGGERDLILAKGVPATLLLALEHRLDAYRKLMDDAPTCDPNFQWEKDPNGVGYTTKPYNTLKTRAEFKSLIAAPATDKHQAAVHVYKDDIPVGTYTQITKSGAMLVSEKSAFLSRIDMLGRAVKTARMRANDIEVENAKMGKAVFDFLKGNLV